MKRTKNSTRIVRRSVALPRALVEDVNALAPTPLRNNFNRLVTAALSQFAETQRVSAFERAMREMAADRQIQAECRAIARDFSRTESDGLPGD